MKQSLKVSVLATLIFLSAFPLMAQEADASREITTLKAEVVVLKSSLAELVKSHQALVAKISELESLLNTQVALTEERSDLEVLLDQQLEERFRLVNVLLTSLGPVLLIILLFGVGSMVLSYYFSVNPPKKD